MTKISILGVLFLLIGQTLWAQPGLYNNGSYIQVTTGGLLHVNGEMISTETSAKVINQGTIEVADGVTDGNFVINNSASVSGAGDFFLTGDWDNNATFVTDNTSNTSLVVFNGTSQNITGTQITTFYDLELTPNNSKKTQTIDAKVSNTLQLSNCELATENNTLYFTNPAPTGVTNDQTYGDEGFISSTTGTFSRATAANAAYFFPVGSSLGSLRYRPVVISPFNLTSNTFNVAMVNNNASNDGYNINSTEESICNINPRWYHRIGRSSGSIEADIQIYYDATQEDTTQYNGIAQWNTPTNSLWNDLYASESGPTAGNYKTVQVAQWDDFSQKPFALTYHGDQGPSISTDDICRLKENVTFTASGGTLPYEWIFPEDVEIISGQGEDVVVVNWGNLFDSVTVRSNLNDYCPTRKTALIPVNTSNIFADFTANTIPGLATVPIQFKDSSTGSAVTWHWDFGDAYTGVGENPSHYYDYPGEYQVVMTVTDASGCKDTSLMRIVVEEFVKIPNVFSPNNDGFNDVFMIPFGAPEGSVFDLKIYNRWGELLFETTASKIEWDGKTATGKNVPDGTYFFTLEAKSLDGEVYDANGDITVIRN